MNKIIRSVALGGTFDHLHEGHKKLLSYAAQLSETLVIGLTTSPMNTKKSYAELIQHYDVREKAINTYMEKIFPHHCVHVIPLKNVYGSTLTNPEIDALVVTEHTKIGADEINAARKANAMTSLPVYVCPFAYDENGEIIASTNIRAGKIDRQGKVYEKMFQKDLKLNEKFREELQNPFGEVFPTFGEWKKQIGNTTGRSVLVGDVVTQEALQHRFDFSYAVIDGKSERKTVMEFSTAQKLSVTNEAGEISHTAVSQVFLKAVVWEEKKFLQVFRIDGEEDLLVIPAVLLSPLGTYVLYGQPAVLGEKGVVSIKVTEQVKIKFVKILQKYFVVR